MIQTENQAKLMTSTKIDNYKLCILAAGKGTRNTAVAGLHKALLPLENKSIISHIIRSVPEHIEIIIATGFKSNQVETYIKTVFPKRNIKFVFVKNYDGTGSGPGYSLLQCKKYLQTPFIFTSADTIVKEVEKLKSLTHDWIGVSYIDVDDSPKYCLVDGHEYLRKLYYGRGNLAYIGMAGIYDYKSYWESLEKANYTHGEYQVISGFDNLKNAKLLNFTWFDTGNNDSYEHARFNFSNEIVAVKNKEVVYIEDKQVIKYFADASKVEKRIQRLEHLHNCAPKVEKINDNMYKYDYIEGQLLSNILDENVLKNVLHYYKKNFGSTKFQKTENFLDDCKKMYHDKTINRISSFANTHLDKIEFINGIKVDNINNLINKINWEQIYKNAIPTNFHGDFQPENIIYNGSDYKLIDWRDSFGDSVSVGDFYYDLGKLYHALLINGQVVLSKGYKYSIEGSQAYVEYNVKNNLLFLIKYFKLFCKENNLNWNNVVLLGILQYIGICTLYDDFHNGEYGKFLFLLGKYMLTKHLKNETI